MLQSSTTSESGTVANALHEFGPCAAAVDDVRYLARTGVMSCDVSASLEKSILDFGRHGFCPSSMLSLCLSVCLSVCLSLRLSLCLSIYLSVSVCPLFYYVPSPPSFLSTTSLLLLASFQDNNIINNNNNNNNNSRGGGADRERDVSKCR